MHKLRLLPLFAALLLSVSTVFAADMPQMTESAGGMPGFGDVRVYLNYAPSQAHPGDWIDVTAVVETDRPVTTNFKWIYNGKTLSEGFRTSQDFVGKSTKIMTVKVPDDQPLGQPIHIAAQVNFDGCLVNDDDWTNNYDYCYIDTVPTDAQIASNDISVKITDYPKSAVTRGETITLSAVVSSSIPVKTNAKWLLFGEPVEGGTFDELDVYGQRVITLTTTVPEYAVGIAEVPYSVVVNDVAQATDADWTNNYEQVAVSAYNPAYMDLNAVFEQALLDARIVSSTPVYAEPNVYSAVLTRAYAGTDCGVYYESYTPGEFSRVVIDGVTGYVPSKAVTRLSTMCVVKDDATNEQKELYVKQMGWDSKTDYMIWINLARQRVNVLKRVDGKWLMFDSFLCSSGKNFSPTPTGQYEIYAKMDRWKFENYWCGPVMYFKPNGYALHSYLIRYDGSLYDGRLGQPLSQGCIRMHPEKINWLYANIPYNTRVVVK